MILRRIGELVSLNSVVSVS